MERLASIRVLSEYETIAPGVGLEPTSSYEHQLTHRYS